MEEMKGQSGSPQSEQQKKEYEKYVKQVTPTHNLWLQMLKAFVTGGIICCIGQFLLNYAGNMGLDDQTAGSWCSLILVFLSVVLTMITTTPGRKPATESQKKTVSAVPLFSVPATIHEASTLRTTSLPASSRKSFPVK